MVSFDCKYLVVNWINVKVNKPTIPEGKRQIRVIVWTRYDGFFEAYYQNDGRFHSACCSNQEITHWMIPDGPNDNAIELGPLE